ncbi:hypothetical protein MCP1_20061 [Candidatus Terasakiella magnetica]|nr:hypothetical protein MCP1_20061 [Candidatus Terasakiella magnetica]
MSADFIARRIVSCDLERLSYCDTVVSLNRYRIAHLEPMQSLPSLVDRKQDRAHHGICICRR